MEYRSYNGASDYPRVLAYSTASCDGIQVQDHAITIFSCNICVNFYEKSYLFDYRSCNNAVTTELMIILECLHILLQVAMEFRGSAMR